MGKAGGNGMAIAFHLPEASTAYIDKMDKSEKKEPLSVCERSRKLTPQHKDSVGAFLRAKHRDNGHQKTFGFETMLAHMFEFDGSEMEQGGNAVFSLENMGLSKRLPKTRTQRQGQQAYMKELAASLLKRFQASRVTAVEQRGLQELQRLRGQRGQRGLQEPQELQLQGLPELRGLLASSGPRLKPASQARSQARQQNGGGR